MTNPTPSLRKKIISLLNQYAESYSQFESIGGPIKAKAKLTAEAADLLSTLFLEWGESSLPQKKDYDTARELRAGTYIRGKEAQTEGYNKAIDRMLANLKQSVAED